MVHLYSKHFKVQTIQYIREYNVLKAYCIILLAWLFVINV